MSNIYIKEPSTNGKILMRTSVGDIDIELWSREAPVACKNFIQLCMEGYYENVIFHRVVPGFIVQGGDPTGTGTGGESVYGRPFKDEFHSRLRFVRRGLVAMANAGSNDNGSQFFFTLGPCNDLNKKHTIFGKVSGDTVYNMIRLGEVQVGEDERPINPPFIKKTKVLANPFDDIVPRVTKIKKKTDEKFQKKSKMKATKDFNLLSFGEEAELDEEETNEYEPKFSFKSSHDLIKDPKLSSQAVSLKDDVPVQKDAVDGDSSDEEKKANDLSYVKNKLSNINKKSKVELQNIENDSDENNAQNKEKKLEQLRKESKRIAKELKQSKKTKEPEVNEKSSDSEEDVKKSNNPLYDDFRKQRKLYKEKTSSNKKKGKDREAITMALLGSFQSKLFSAREKEKPNNIETEDREDDSDWLKHEFVGEDDMLRDAKDMNRDVNEDRYDIIDPRNPINKRRRENDKEKGKSKKHKISSDNRR